MAKIIAALACVELAAAFHSGLPPAVPMRQRTAGICMAAEHSGRRAALSVLGGIAIGGFAGGGNDEAWALVKGLPPPENYGKG